eukprot:scaffold7554_cov143-Skeletonema_menzelii.AAC.4
MVRIVKISWDDSLPLTVEEIGGPENNSKTNAQNFGDAIPSCLESRAAEQNAVVVETALLRNSESVAGLFAYSFSNITQSTASYPNIRATRLAMACGLHNQRFAGDVYIGRLGYMSNQLKNLDLCLSDVQNACECSPDLRHEILVTFNDVNFPTSPEWLENAAQMNYHDGASLAALANAMMRSEISDDDEETDDSSSSASDGSSRSSSMPEQRVLTKIPLCLHCRGPASTLCPGCEAVYFCDTPRKCQELAWSHQCLCKTWQRYADHRDELSSFPYFSGWQTPLLQKDCFTSENVYEIYLKELGVIASQEGTSKRNWWTTELHGWAGGESSSAKDVDIFHRVSFAEGFALDNIEWIPQERHVTTDDSDEHGLPILNSWQGWYQLRQIPSSSPVALLETFPLTLYYAIQHYGSVPLTVSKMLERPLRVHLVGIEKELNFIDLFREVGYLLPKESVQVDMTWIVREDMLPQNSKGGKSLSLQLTSNLTLTIVAGTYGESVDPDFDLNGSPDMILGLNAGLYAYESWRHVVNYLNTHPNVVGVFTDYNEHSGLNCASLGGSKARKSLTMNPFRQPRAMPVYCMNLPQFSNGFIYIFNEQELE